MNDNIIIINTDDEEKEATLISTFKMNEECEYVIYKLDNDYYGAKYKYDGNNTILDTNLNDIEKETLNELFKEIGVE